MSLAEFRVGLSELYQGEVIGEVVFSRLLARFDSADQQYKLASLLQLETETKARLRPTAMKLGVDLVELEESRDQGEEFDRSFAGMDWRSAMAHLASVVVPYVERYRQIAEIAPTEYKEIADSMVVHEQSVQKFAELEAAGQGDRSLDVVVKQLIFPLPRNA
jgi:hypothetical protein